MEEEELFENEPVETPAETPAEQPAAEPLVEQNEPETELNPEPVETGNVTTDFKPEPGFVPFGAVLDERDKRKALEAKLAQYEAQAKPQEEVPDMFADPDGWQAHQQRQFQGALYSQRLDISRRFAEQQHGQEAVEKALEWGFNKCSSDPYFNATVQSQPDPVGYAVQQYQREQIASAVDPSEFEQFKAWKTAQSAIQPPPQSNPSKPRKSIASAPSAGGVQHVALGDGAIFDEEF